ncbi:hypothetical protein SLEP1_g16452 [Rubroshorea leprosula]|uniref:Late embryogenesis abundant protein LEA-2 subgroup domain-containing protein n=1 Tax=Rubroshorea leprosula TaxID=152421 RepID=A0AAV5J061_9ROSI|nr:hypothetical protein SLEP1_g16452 [Rubroshorea leprosula]
MRKSYGKNPCFIAIAVLLAVGLLILILALTVFKAKKPVTTINSVHLGHLDVGLDFPRLGVSLNVTLDVDLSVKNPNKVGFKYKNSSAELNYRGKLVGEVPIPAGEISPDETVGMNLTVTVMADRLLSDSSQLFSDVLSGVLPINTLTRISGKVKLLNLFKIKVISTTSCDVTIFTSNRTIADQDCKYKTQL